MKMVMDWTHITKTEEYMTCQALQWNLQGKHGRGRARSTWRGLQMARPGKAGTDKDEVETYCLWPMLELGAKGLKFGKINPIQISH